MDMKNLCVQTSSCVSGLVWDPKRGQEIASAFDTRFHPYITSPICNRAGRGGSKIKEKLMIKFSRSVDFNRGKFKTNKATLHIFSLRFLVDLSMLALK